MSSRMAKVCSTWSIWSLFPKSQRKKRSFLRCLPSSQNQEYTKSTDSKTLSIVPVVATTQSISVLGRVTLKVWTECSSSCAIVRSSSSKTRRSSVITVSKIGRNGRSNRKVSIVNLSAILRRSWRSLRECDIPFFVLCSLFHKIDLSYSPCHPPS